MVSEKGWIRALRGQVSDLSSLAFKADDGFKLAEEDLRLRGPGEFFGTRQSGLPELRLASVGDTRTVESARQAAEQILAEDPALAQPRHALLARRMDDFWSRGNERS